MNQEKAMERNHSVKITSGKQNSKISVDEVGGFVMKNGVTGKEHNVTLWAYGIEEDGSIEDIALYIDDPEEIVRLTAEGMSIDGAASDALIDYTLDDLIRNDQEVWPLIEKYSEDLNAEFEYSIPIKDIKPDLHNLIVSIEVADLIMKSDRGSLDKQDILAFGQLVKGDPLIYDVGSELRKPIETVLNREGFEPSESELIGSALKTLNLQEAVLQERNINDRSASFTKNDFAVKAEVEKEISR